MTLPVLPMVLPSSLQGQRNGQLPSNLLVPVAGAGGHHGLLHVRAAQAWNDLVERMRAMGVNLTSTSNGDFYRSLAAQTALFQERYSPTLIPMRPTKTWNGKTYWLRPKMAQAATPGTSNHGWGLAIDMAEFIGGQIVPLRKSTLDWMCTVGVSLGWSAELQSETWHWRWNAGDKPTASTTASAPVAVTPPPTFTDIEETAVRAADIHMATDDQGNGWTPITENGTAIPFSRMLAATVVSAPPDLGLGGPFGYHDGRVQLADHGAVGGVVIVQGWMPHSDVTVRVLVA